MTASILGRVCGNSAFACLFCKFKMVLKYSLLSKKTKLAWDEWGKNAGEPSRIKARRPFRKLPKE